MQRRVSAELLRICLWPCWNVRSTPSQHCDVQCLLWKTGWAFTRWRPDIPRNSGGVWLSFHMPRFVTWFFWCVHVLLSQNVEATRTPLQRCVWLARSHGLRANRYNLKPYYNWHVTKKCICSTWFCTINQKFLTINQVVRHVSASMTSRTLQIGYQHSLWLSELFQLLGKSFLPLFRHHVNARWARCFFGGC